MRVYSIKGFRSRSFVMQVVDGWIVLPEMGSVDEFKGMLNNALAEADG